MRGCAITIQNNVDNLKLHLCGKKKPLFLHAVLLTKLLNLHDYISIETIRIRNGRFGM